MNNEVWKEFAAHEVSHSVAHYLTTILDLRKRKGYAILKDVAEELQVTKGSASVQIKHLKEKGLVDEVDRHHLKLTEAGKKEARKVIYNRQVICHLLHRVLGLDAYQAEVDACKVEHLLSHEASHRLLALVQLLQSDEPAAIEFRKRFREFELTCPGPENCKLCGDVCLVEID
jgi:DtxR family Mn-dependent transcriptional regulator